MGWRNSKSIELSSSSDDPTQVARDCLTKIYDTVSLNVIQNSGNKQENQFYD